MNRADQLIRTLKEQGIVNDRVLTAIREMHRQRFVPPALVDSAWENHALPFGNSDCPL